MNGIDKTNLSEQTKFRLSEIIGIENYFQQEIYQRKPCSKNLSKYVTAFDYIDKFYFNFFSNIRNNQKITKYNKKEKEEA